MTGNKILRISMVSIIAIGAAYGSFWHIVDLVAAHGQGGVMSYAYPIMVDALMIFSSVTLSSKAVNRPTRLWCRVGLLVGVAGSLSANALSSDLSDTLTASIAVFPSVVLIITVEILLHSVKGVRHGRARRSTRQRDMENTVRTHGTRRQAADLTAGRASVSRIG